MHQGIKSYLNARISAGEPVLNTPSTNRVLGDLHSRSVVRFVQDGQAIVYGSFEGFRGKHKSAVCETIVAPLLVERGYKIEHGAPIMNGWEPWRRAFLASTKREFNFDPNILKEAKDGYLRDILERLPSEELSLIEVYDDMTAINGVPGVKYVDKMKRNTSAGNPWKKSKKYLISPLSFVNAEIDGMYIDEKHDILSSIMYDDAITFDEEVMARVDDCILKYHAGERYCPVFCAHLKDEATSFKKIAIAKTRVFSGAPADWSIVVRKYLLSVVRVMQRNKLVFECAPGTVAQSQEWELFYNYLTQFGEDQIVAGDYKEFDKSMQANLILMAFDILIELCEKAGYTSKDLMVVEGIALDTAYSFMDFNGDLIQFFGQNPSGHPLTVIINCIVNSIYLRYAYIKLNPHKEVSSFRKNVAPLTYGDDNIMGISQNIPWYNHTTISEVFSTVGLGYTMADKEAESVPYINISEATFLKRSWRWDEDLQTHVCPIEHDSINRSLTMCVKSKTLCPEAQAIEVIGSAHREYFFYGKDVFEEKEKLLREIVQAAGLQLYVNDATFQTWDALKEKWFSYKVDIHKIT
nr:nonstructural protein [Flumine marna-like virus 1]